MPFFKIKKELRGPLSILSHFTSTLALHFTNECYTEVQRTVIFVVTV